ncbi:sensor histidine kinase [Persicitalea sp.]|uniref:sensor histidine kinase n=1 Tax=Persicitalea sp. TaxID=3100273 RepID=UPI0035936CF0
MPSDSVEPPVEIADYLFSRRDAILQRWRMKCEEDESLAHVVVLDRIEFNDHLPMILNILGQRLRNEPEDANPVRLANFHGLHRWRKGRMLGDILNELDYLYDILNDELRIYHGYNSQVEAMVILDAAMQIVRLKEETIRGSVSEYALQQQIAAASRSAGLQRALDDLNQLGRSRGEILRTSSHDLKSNFGVIQGVLTLLNREDRSEEERSQLVEMLSRNLTHLQDVLVQLTDLARLEAGQEELHLSEFDASQIINEIVAAARPLAESKNLMLMANGPEQLNVRGDVVKVKRIAHNLLINAINYTSVGVVSVSWSSEDGIRWYLGIQDSGPGLPPNLASVISAQLKPQPEPTAVLQPDPTAGTETPPISQPEKPVAAPNQPGGEGVGLHIVKHLCELMSASLTVESVAGKGTLFSIRLPMTYSH